MMRYEIARRSQLRVVTPGRGRFEGYQFSLFAPPTSAGEFRNLAAQPYVVRSAPPALRPIVARYGSRCPECAGPLVSGEGCVACPVCGFRRQAL